MFVNIVMLWLMFFVFLENLLIIWFIGLVWKKDIGVLSMEFNMLLCKCCVVERFENIS